MIASPRLRSAKRPLYGCLLLLAALFLFILGQESAAASSFIFVNTFDDEVTDDAFCSLREAVIAANTDTATGGCPAGSDSEPDIIYLTDGVYELSISPAFFAAANAGSNPQSLDVAPSDASYGDLNISGDVKITGSGAHLTTISAEGLYERVFEIESGDVTLEHLTVSGGESSEDGGGIQTHTDLELNYVAIRDNISEESGGGLAISGDGSARLTAVTISDNLAGHEGGGVEIDGSLSAINSTFSNNGAGSEGNALYVDGPTDLSFVTIADNLGEIPIGTVIDDDVSLTIYHTILDDGCEGDIISLGYNAINGVSSCTISGDTTGNLIDAFAALEGLDDNGGETETHALPEGSILIDAGDSSDCPSTDQRDVERPQFDYCDIGAFEFEDDLAILVVNTDNDVDDGSCDDSHCSLREALLELQGEEEDEGEIFIDGGGEIHFDIPGSGTPTITVLSPLPFVTSDILIDGTTQPGGSVRIDGSGAGSSTDGLSISGYDIIIRGLEIVNFDGHGIVIEYSDDVLIELNEIAFNGGNGVRTLFSFTVTITQNNIHDNGGLPIDLDGDGRTPNLPVDPTADEFDLPQNFPVIFTAVPGGDLTVQGLLFSNPESTFTIELFSSATCDLSTTGPQTFIDDFEVTTGENGNVYFLEDDLPSVPAGSFLVATATSQFGDTSEFSDCVNVSLDNTSWPKALTLPVSGDLSPTEIEQFIDQYGQSRWFKFAVDPNSNIIVTLTNLPANYDLTIYQDINAVYQSLLNPTEEDLTQLNAEFAPEAFSPEAFSPEAFSPEAFSPEAFSPEAFSPEAFSPEAFSPEAFSPEAFSPEAFSSAQVRSLLGVSAFPSRASEGLTINTWNRSGEFYIRVRGSGGAFNTQQPFTLSVQMQSDICSGIAPIGAAHTATIASGDYKTLVLTDFSRMGDSAANLQTLQNRLNAFIARPEVMGTVLDLNSDQQVRQLNAQADANPGCPYAKNLVADSIKELVEAHRAANPNLQYVVIIGNDFVVPFFRYPDNASLANENNYVPPVRDSSASQASLRLGYVLGQDEYGSSNELLFKNSTIPIPDLAIGRLVETAAEATAVLDAYLATSDGVVTVNTSSLVTGYDFLDDVANAVRDELQAGTGINVDTLITPANVAPTDPVSWTAQQLASVWLTERRDITFLAGHFSQSGALAADYTTRLSTADLLASPVDMQNALIFSVGCHSGYSLVDADGVPFVTETPDWAQAFARKGATLIGGTGYQYGDTEFIEYSERLYLLFSQQLRTGSGPVAIGDALNTAKIEYLAGTQTMRGIHQKALLQSTVFGLPMLQFDLTGTRLTGGAGGTAVSSPTPYTTNPGQTFGLSFFDLSVSPNSVEETMLLKDVTDGSNVMTTYLTGPDGVVANPAEPVLPLKFVNVSLPNTVLRGVGFRGGSYTLLENIIPLTGAPTTEIRGVHAPFEVEFFYPVQMWKSNYYGRLSGNNLTQLGITAAQFRSNGVGALDGSLRKYTDLDLRLFYNDDVAVLSGGGTPALAAPPTIVETTATRVGDTVLFRAVVVGNPAAGIQTVWVTYTGDDLPFAGVWQSLDLTQSPDDSTVWEAMLPLDGADPTNLRYLVQAVNGTGLVSLASNLGQGYGVDVLGALPDAEETTVELVGPTSGAYSDAVSFTATLRSGGVPLSGERVRISVGTQSRSAVTNASGEATVTITLLGMPGSVTAQASYGGSLEYLPSNVSRPFTILKKGTVVTLTQPASGMATDAQLLEILLTDSSGKRLPEKTVVVVIEGAAVSLTRAVITDFVGRATVGNLPELVPGSYSVSVYFVGAIPLHTGETLTLTDLLYKASSTSGTLSIGGDTAEPMIYISAYWNNKVDGVVFRNEDILVYDPNSDTWAIHFDGSDVGLHRNDVDAFAILNDGDILLSLKHPQNRLGSIGPVDDSDILRFIPTSIGDETAGMFELVLDGSDVGLTGGNEDIDAIGVLGDGRIIISTQGHVSVPGVSATAQDLLVFDATSLGENSAGTWSLYFDGSQAELNNWREVLRGVSVDAATGQLFLNTRQNFAVTGVSGTGNDIFGCDPANSDPITACVYSFFWDAAAAGFDFRKPIVDAIHVGSPSVPTDPGPGPGDEPTGIYLTFTQRKDLDGVRYYNEDILRYDVDLGSWSLFFDGSLVGMVADDIDAFTILEDGDILFSVEVARSGFPDIGSVDDSDVVRFTPATSGDYSAGTFTLYFDGSDVGLEETGEDIDALTVTAAGDLIVSTSYKYDLPGGLTGKAQDLLLFSATSLGETTAGTWSLYMDGEAVGLLTWRENVNGVHLNPDSGLLTLNTRTNFEVANASGSGNDLFRCDPANSGPITNCFFELIWEAVANGLDGRPIVNGVYID